LTKNGQKPSKESPAAQREKSEGVLTQKFGREKKKKTWERNFHAENKRSLTEGIGQISMCLCQGAANTAPTVVADGCFGSGLNTEDVRVGHPRGRGGDIRRKGQKGILTVQTDDEAEKSGGRG